MTTMTKDFGKLIHDMRKAKEYSLEEVANRSGVIASYIWRIEKEERKPSLDVQLKILAFAFGYDEEALAEFSRGYIVEMLEKGIVKDN